MTPDGGPAFPVEYDYGHVGSEGMSLRDYFAAHALAAILARLPLVKSENTANLVALHNVPAASDNERAALRRYAANGAYLLADAMLEARKS